MGNTVGGNMEDVEVPKTRLSGTIYGIHSNYSFQIRGQDGKEYRSISTMLAGHLKDEFNGLEEGMEVTFVPNGSETGYFATEVITPSFQEAAALSSQTKDTIDWIMKGGSDSAEDSAKMSEKLERLKLGIESASKLYSERYGQDYENIRGAMMNIEYGMTEQFRLDIIDLQVLFSGLQGMELSAEDINLFRGLQLKFMEKSPEIQSNMLRFFECVNDYVISKSNDLTIRTNPIKNILFAGKDISYKQWISGIVDRFENNSIGASEVINSIRNAEAPQIGLKQFIRKLFDTKPEVLEEGDRTWLRALYTQWPDESVTNKQGTLTSEEKKERDRIAKKYVFEHSEYGNALPEDLEIANDFMLQIRFMHKIKNK